ncbi:putative protein kinase RLK-Pelle-RLCK-VIIa-2 family [Helianthus annuus]|uniref:Protein kinase domain-containing protein n=1 Tax=Helianthus annuus TaxID=4232 RepID=A0A251VRL2_HELAN|nr:serine/threonine-protein kinase PCRK1 [Helianthus annuus]KAF5823633.1 putative protein kinase RLK-Pelle-RLCK-VIIa-2 family [Helianthus annuus]KAJ0628334.1 putative protein kinase RLK-Pelle-RLCK-VIIa-2 family [Helianthus annuus]KAJ0784619.1 putative protein kinase RLK-Pelle-RLCK-VIIa-2 family [Helianthus annuus]
MVFHCRCFSLLEDDEELTYESTTTQTKSTTTYYTAASDFSRSHAKTLQVLNLANKGSNLRVFTFAELKTATENFCTASKIGEGVFGSVYKGVIKSLDLDHPMQVAVKLTNELLQGHKGRAREINARGSVEHPNLVKLIGYCTEDNELGTKLLFVYEYMVNRSVRDHLSAKSETPLSWNMRLKVAQDVARGLTFLHEQMEFQMIFMNFKSSNVLLDDQWNAKLSGFGVPQMQKEITHIKTKTAAPVFIDIGYSPPEYFVKRHRTSKVDVWSYGVFLYELITGRHPFDKKLPFNEQRLVQWVQPYLGSDRFELIIDPRLEGNYPLESAQKLSIIADKCLSESPNSRPKMSEVLEMVNQLIMVQSQATSPASTQVPQVVIDPNKVFAAPAQGEKTQEDIKHEDERASSKPAYLPQIRYSKLWKSLKCCSGKGCCVSLH